jgi:methylmalonyl-CoA mutase N-terminal domain/subunit
MSIKSKSNLGSRSSSGVNKYVMPQDEKAKVNILRVDPEVQRRQIERLKRVRAERDNRAVKRALERLEEAARSRENTMPYILEAVKAYASVGEIMEVLKKVHGAYREPASFA